MIFSSSKIYTVCIANFHRCITNNISLTIKLPKIGKIPLNHSKLLLESKLNIYLTWARDYA